jgi:hypothetical protein
MHREQKLSGISSAIQAIGLNVEPHALSSKPRSDLLAGVG